MLFNPHSLDGLGRDCRPAIVFFLLVSFAPAYVSAEPGLPLLTTDTQLATAGYYQLSWRPGSAQVSHKALHFELQQSATADFQSVKTIYRGPDRASVISGQPDGDYYYRIRAMNDQTSTAWSRPVVVEVRHHSLVRALGFFATGAAVFFVTLLFIVFRSRHRAGG